MLKWLMRRGITAFERQWSYDASYLREIVEADPRAAWKFQRATSLGKYRRDVPIDALIAAGITAVRHEDCGPCTQLGVSMAEREGVDPKVLFDYSFTQVADALGRNEVACRRERSRFVRDGRRAPVWAAGTPCGGGRLPRA